MKTISNLIIATIITLFSACNPQVINYSAPANHSAVQAKNFSLDASFSEILASSNFEITYNIEPKATCRIEAPGDLIDHIKIEIKNNTLIFSLDDADRLDTSNATFSVSLKAPAVNSLKMSGNSSITLLDPIDLDHLDVETSGNSIVKLPQVDAHTLKANLKGNASLNIKQITANRLDFDLSGNSAAEISTSKAADLQARTSGNSTLTLSDTHLASVQAHASGNSGITLRGKSSTVDLDASGNSHIDARRLAANSGTASASGNSIITSHVADLSQSSSANASISNH